MISRVPSAHGCRHYNRSKRRGRSVDRGFAILQPEPRVWRHKARRAVYVGDPGPSPLYSSRVGQPCIVVSDSSEEHYPLVIRWADGECGIAEREAVREDDKAERAIQETTLPMEC